jgi:hypothetical protein
MVKKKRNQAIKLDISYGPFIPEGFERFDAIAKLPWPFEDNSVEEVYSGFIFCRIPAKQRPLFMEELYRVVKPEAKVTMINPYWSTALAIQDYAHEWPPVVEQSFLYFDKQWRESQQDPRGLKCDFNVGGGHVYEPETNARSEETRNFWVRRYLNTVQTLQIVLTKRRNGQLE